MDGLFFSFAVLGTIGLIDIPPSSPSSVPIASSRASHLKNTIDISSNPRVDNIDSYTNNDEVNNEDISKTMNSWIPTENKENQINNNNDVDSLFVVLCTCYLLIGLAIISMCVQLMEHTCRDILQRLATTRLMGRHGSWMFAVYGVFMMKS